MTNSCDTWREHRRALEEWRRAYADYIAATPAERPTWRAAVDSASRAAERALSVVPVAIAAPHAAGEGYDHTLGEVVRWIHDASSATPQSFSWSLIDAIDEAIAWLWTRERLDDSCQ